MSTPLSADEFKAKLLKAKSEEEQRLNDRILELYEFTRTQVASAISSGETSIYVGFDRRFSSDERRAAKYSINEKLAADSEFREFRLYLGDRGYVDISPKTSFKDLISSFMRLWR